ncbi:hypothetical protein BJX70DRAFT_401466 [Aspergillus crustosus]
MFSIPTDESDVPAGLPPPGVVPNFVDHPSLQPAIVSLEAVFMTLILLAVATRIYVRTHILKLWGWEDTTCILATCGSIANIAMFMKCMSLGFGRHIWDVPLKIFLDPYNNRLTTYQIHAVSITYPWTVLRQTLNPPAGLVVITVLYATFIILSIFNTVICTEIYSDVSPFCAFPHLDVVIWTVTVNVATDLYVVILPMNRFRKLHLSARRRVGLCLVFASGLGRVIFYSACAASIARLVIIVQNMASTDSIWASAEVALFSITEIDIGIIVACVCTSPKFIQRMPELQMRDKVSLAFGRLHSRGQVSIDSILPPQGQETSTRVRTPVSRSKIKMSLAEEIHDLDGVNSRGSL